MCSIAKAWLVRPRPHGINRMAEFKANSIVAVGWPGIGSLSGKSREELKKLLSGPPYDLGGLALGNAYATVDIFVNQMREGDLILVPDGADIYFCQIRSPYNYDPRVDNDTDGYPHQREVAWLPANLSREGLSKSLRSALKVHRTVANLSHHFAEIDALAHGQPYVPGEEASNRVEVAYPLRPDFPIRFEIPSDMTRDEAQRLSSYFASLYFTE